MTTRIDKILADMARLKRGGDQRAQKRAVYPPRPQRRATSRDDKRHSKENKQ
jgi:hypothetical protein